MSIASFTSILRCYGASGAWFEFVQRPNFCLPPLLSLQIVDVQQSSVNLAATKVEIKLRKAEPSSWRTLIIEKALPSENKTDDEKAKCEELEQRVDAVDLSDL